MSIHIAAPLLGPATLVVLSLAAATAQAQTTINFNSFTAQATADGGEYSFGNSYDTQGFTLLASNSAGFEVFAGNSPTYGDGETSFFSIGAGTTTLTRDNGQTFSLNAIDLGPYEGNSQGTTSDGSTLFTGTRADGTMVIATETTSSSQGQYQTFGFIGFTNLTSLTFKQQSGATQFDNVVLNAPAAVPEVTTSIGFGVLLTLATAGAVLRRRKAIAS